jgi:glucose dehydrogenase
MRFVMILRINEVLFLLKIIKHLVLLMEMRWVFFEVGFKFYILFTRISIFRGLSNKIHPKFFLL